MRVGQSLTGKIALVTQGSRGIGAAIVQRLADEGAIVLFTHVGDAAAAQELVTRIATSGSIAVAIETDGTAQAPIETAIPEAVARFGRIDILVGNAELLGFGAAPPLALHALEDAKRMSMRSLLAPVAAVLSHMPAGGRIIATRSSTVDPRPQSSIRSRRVAAHIARAMTRDVVSRGITVNLVQSGEIDRRSFSSDSDAASAAADCVARTSQSGGDVASLVAYLASDEAGFITGAALSADGDYLG